MDGFLNLFKPSGPTSADMIDAVRAALGVNAGHAGTLDPLAEGVLPVGLGAARRLLPYLRHDKEYEGVLRLGQESDTQDLGGTLTEPRPVTTDAATVRAAGETLTGDLILPVPMYSAVHVGGRRLHELARAGAAITPPTRTMTIFSLEVLEVDLPRVRFRVSCAGGTYVRSLAAEWGRRLGCGGLLERLARTRAGSFLLADTIRPDALAALAQAGRAGEAVVPAARALAHCPEVRLSDADATRLTQGQWVAPPPDLVAAAGAPLRATRPDGRLVGIASLDAVRGAGAPVLVAVRMLPPGTAMA